MAESITGFNDKSKDVESETKEAVFSAYSRRKLDYSLYERQVRARIMTALNRSRLLAAELAWSE